MEGEQAYFYYQIIRGSVKMLNTNEEGKEFVQGIFKDGESFGEPPLFQNSVYPASAFVEAGATLYKMPKVAFFQLLKEHFDIHLQFTATLAKRLMYKAMIMREISSHDAKHRILTLIDYLKSEYGQPGQPFKVMLTRQQISDLLGIRVETVIRTIKQMEEEGLVKITGRKVFR